MVAFEPAIPSASRLIIDLQTAKRRQRPATTFDPQKYRLARYHRRLHQRQQLIRCLRIRFGGVGEHIEILANRARRTGTVTHIMISRRLNIKTVITRSPNDIADLLLAIAPFGRDRSHRQ